MKIYTILEFIPRAKFATISKNRNPEIFLISFLTVIPPQLIIVHLRNIICSFFYIIHLKSIKT